MLGAQALASSMLRFTPAERQCSFGRVADQALLRRLAGHSEIEESDNDRQRAPRLLGQLGG